MESQKSRFQLHKWGDFAVGEFIRRYYVLNNLIQVHVRQGTELISSLLNVSSRISSLNDRFSGKFHCYRDRFFL